MKHVKLALVLAAAVLSASCVKMVQSGVVNADNTAKIKMTVGYKLDSIDGLKSFMDGLPIPEEAKEEMFTNLDEIPSKFSDKEIVEKIKKAGVDVTSSATVEKEGWKLVEIEGAIKDVNAFIANSAADMKKGMSEDGMDEAIASRMGNVGFRFFKTAEADVAKFSIMPPLNDLLPEQADEAMEKLDELGDEERAQIEMFLDMFRAAVSLDQMRVEMKFTLPGKIQSVKGCKQEGEDTIVMTLKGSDIGLDGAKDVFGLKNGVYATFKFDPQTFKINLVDEKVAESRGTTPSAPVEPAKEKKNEEEKKKGEDG
jgi:hypothetical protein